MNISSSRTSRGTLFGIGVGPGDPDSLTLQAIKRLEKVDTSSRPPLRATSNPLRCPSHAPIFGKMWKHSA